MPETIELTEEEQREQNIFTRYLSYKRLSVRLGQSLEREQQKVIDLQCENQRIEKACEARIAEMKTHYDSVMRMRDKREATLTDDLAETTRELTELATRVTFIKEAADEAEHHAAASRHAPKAPTPPREGAIQRGMERALGDLISRGEEKEVHVPPVAEMRPRGNMLAKFVDDHADEEMPSFLRNPLPPEPERGNPLKELLNTLSPKTAPDHEEQREHEEDRR